MFYLYRALPQHLLTKCAGYLAACKVAWLKNLLIDWFVQHYQVDISESEEDNPHNYADFNAFFTRQLRFGARQIDEHALRVVSPVDGRISQIGVIENDTIIQAKKFHFSVQAVLGDADIAAEFNKGNFATIYLSPRDYHRVHMPLPGKLVKVLYIPGDLFAVNHCSAQTVPNLYARNERVVMLFATAHGPMAMILVGAIIVGSIETIWHGVHTAVHPRQITSWDYAAKNIELAKGDEVGRFKLGSTVILLFPKDVVHWQEQAVVGRKVKMGECLGVLQE